MKIPVKPSPEDLDACVCILKNLKRKVTELTLSAYPSYGLMLSVKEDIVTIEKLSPGFIDRIHLFRGALIKTELYLALFSNGK